MNRRPPAQPAIADHGLVGDLRTSALVGIDGTIDWFCCPRFDSPSVFASLLDEHDGGCWQLSSDHEQTRTQQFYYPGSNVLITRFLTPEGVVEVHDFMAVLRPHDRDHRQRLVRRVVGVRGHAAISMRLAARPNYGREVPELTLDGRCVEICSDSVRLGLSATVDVTVEEDVQAHVDVSSGDTVLFVLETLDDDAPVEPCSDAELLLFEQTVDFWRTWLGQSAYAGRWREMVDRSALTLKLLSHEPTGAIIAAPTTSLPERIGGERNWDYRYVWVRDAAFSLYALLRLGFMDEAAGFMAWLAERIGEADGESAGPLRAIYSIDGAHEVTEETLDHLGGYRGSRPVRIGNGAEQQLQIDIYGELIDSIYLFNKYGDGISHDAWTDLTDVLEWLLDHWDSPDAGMWESRGDRQDHTSSRLMAWVAIERAIRIARQRGLPGDIPRWSRVRDAIYDQIMDRSWDTQAQTFVRTLDGAQVDAALLLMPMVKFIAPNDPRFVRTLAAIEERLVADSLVFRYRQDDVDDGVDGGEGTFSICSFWYVEALTRTGRLEDARLALEKMFTYANHLGLYAEQIDITGDQLGNFPQAFTHLSLISAATNLDRALS